MRKIERIHEYYKKVVGKKREDYAKLGWESRQAHHGRFEILLDNLSLENKKILDVGCGLGNLYGYLIERGVSAHYTGVDLLQTMVDLAVQKYPDGRFLCLDLFQGDFFAPNSFDVIFASGIFNLNLGNNEEFLSNAMKKFFCLSKEVVCFNMLHIGSPEPEDKYFYIHPDRAVEIVRNSVSQPVDICLYEKYLSNDFTLICRKT